MKSQILKFKEKIGHEKSYSLLDRIITCHSQFLHHNMHFLIVNMYFKQFLQLKQDWWILLKVKRDTITCLAWIVAILRQRSTKDMYSSKIRRKKIVSLKNMISDQEWWVASKSGMVLYPVSTRYWFLTTNSDLRTNT